MLAQRHRRPSPRETQPAGVAVDPTTNTIYVTDFGNGSDPSTVSVINGSTCARGQHQRVQPALNTIRVGVAPNAIAIDPASHTAYIANQADDTVSVIDIATCNARHIDGCGQAPTTIPVGANPIWIDLSAATHTAYVVNQNDHTVSVINTATCDATHTAGCSTTPPTVAAGQSPISALLDPATHTLYVTAPVTER